MDSFILHCFQDGLLRPEEITDRKVLEVGSRDVNGSVRPIVESCLPASYLGVDIQDGPGVDKILDCLELTATFGYNAFDIVITTEMVEHIENWKSCFIQLTNVVAENGFLIITTRSPGFPYHDFPGDYWRYTMDFMYKVMTALNFAVVQCLPDIQYPGIIIKARKMEDWSGWDTPSLKLMHLEPEPVPQP